MDISKSLFGLLKNNGLFKSEKQAEFLTKFLANDLTYYTSFNYNLGSEYNFKSCGSSSFEFYCDNKGVKKIIKTTSTNKTSVYFERLSVKVFKEKQDKIAASKAAHEENRKELDLLIEHEYRLRSLCVACAIYENVKEIKSKIEDQTVAKNYLRLLIKDKATLTGKAFIGFKEQHYNVNKRFTLIYNEYLKAVQATHDFDRL